MKIVKERIELRSQKQLEFINITDAVHETVDRSGIKNGMVTVFCPHTTAAIAVNHDEHMLLQDLTRLLYRLVPVDERYSHDMFELTQEKRSDGRSNAHSHCKNMLLTVSETIPLSDRALMMGEKQNIFFVELDGARKRDFVIHIMGE